MTVFEEVSEFSKDVKKLRKKYRSIDDDLVIFKKALKSNLPNQLPGIVRVCNLGQDVKNPIYKVRYFRCKTLKGKGNKSGIRIVYAYEETEDRITFIEMYHKNKKENEDKHRILKYFSIKEDKNK